MKKSKKFKGIDWSNLKFALVVLAAAYVYEIILKRVNNSTGGGSQLRNGVCLSVGIVSASLNVQQRASIRQGWGRSRDICRRRFFIATNKDWTVVQKVSACMLLWGFFLYSFIPFFCYFASNTTL